MTYSSTVPVTPRIALAHASVGSGHRVAAEALRDSLEACGARVDLIDALDHGVLRVDGDRATTAFTGPLAPLYDRAWRCRWFSPSEARVAPLATIMYAGLRDKLRELSPDVVACTHALPAMIAARERASGRAGYAVAGVMTDLMPHTVWPLSADLICASTEQAREALVSRGVRPDGVVVTGTPLRAAFDPGPDREKSRAEMAVPRETSLVLVVAGAAQPGPYVRFVRAVPGLVAALSAAPGVRTVIICGRDEALRRSLAIDPPESVEVHGYVADMPRYMAAADLLVGKPGGLMTAEALAVRLPMMFVGPAWGQERSNAELLVGAGAAEAVRDPSRAGVATAALAADARRLSIMRAAQDSLAKPRSAAAAAASIMRLAEDRRPSPHPE